MTDRAPAKAASSAAWVGVSEEGAAPPDDAPCEVDEHHVVRGEFVIADPAGLDRENTGGPVEHAGVAEGEVDQSACAEGAVDRAAFLADVIVPAHAAKPPERW